MNKTKIKKLAIIIIIIAITITNRKIKKTKMKNLKDQDNITIIKPEVKEDLKTKITIMDANITKSIIYNLLNINYLK